MHQTQPPTSDWHGCFDSRGWSKNVVRDAFSHPAKFAYGQINRIVLDGLKRGFWRQGELIGDPFAGVALGGIVAAYHGLRWVGVEVEPRYHAIALANFQLHRLRREALAAAQPQCLLGDSRHLNEIVAEHGCAAWQAVITSPPYESVQLQQNAGCWERKFERYPDLLGILRPGGANTQGAPPRYGWSDGQIGRYSGKRYRRMNSAIFGQMLALLPPGGVAAVVARDYVCDSQRVAFADRTANLLKEQGFELFERTHCWLVSEQTHRSLFGDEIVERRTRKSFFRRPERHGLAA